MHDELMDDDGARAAADAFETRVAGVLEAQPKVSVPVDFAARVAARVAVPRTGLVRVTALREMRVRRTYYGYAMMAVSMVVLLVAMILVAPKAVSSSAIWVGVEWALCAQFALLALWFGLRRERLQ